ncbi:tetraspanin-15-like [Populus alba x Populus x berolinensis]|uniref:Tetraspanin-15-like n=1 Tax=Populus alba x Populus x berolinensis TaxID=444605 RepID=A0AAD6VZU8_9ROSI|nr:tetraspanin-15-like [Populus alba x Populus x berolinensis]
MAENTNPTEALAMTIAEETTKTKKEVAGNTKSDEKVNQVKNYASIVSIITFVLSVLILASAIWLLYMKDYDCEELLWLPRLQIGIGIGLIFVSLISNIAVLLRSRFPVPGFFLVMVPLIVMLTMGLALVGANKLESRRLMATPKWFREKVRHNDNWENIKSCIYNTGTCDDLVSRSLNLKAFDFSIKKLSSIEAGCCKPPSICQMEYVNATFWTKVEGAVDESQQQYSDCATWQNDQNILCYNCGSCRHGFVRVMESKWRNLGVLLILMGLLLIVAHLSLFVMVMWEHYN